MGVPARTNVNGATTTTTRGNKNSTKKDTAANNNNNNNNNTKVTAALAGVERSEDVRTLSRASELTWRRRVCTLEAFRHRCPLRIKARPSLGCSAAHVDGIRSIKCGP